MFIGFMIILMGLIAIVWPAAYFLTKAACTIAERRERKRREARAKEYEARDRRAREERAKIWEERFSQMTQEEHEEFMNCLFT